LFLNIIEPLRERYPGFVINSGWRPTDTAHGYAAVDLQWPNYMSNRRKMIEIATWVANKFPTRPNIARASRFFEQYSVVTHWL